MPVYFTVKGQRYERIQPDDWTFAEGHEFQRISGMSAGMGALALQEMNTDAWLGMIVVSMRRTNPDATEHDLADLTIGEVLGTIENIDVEADPEPNPPTASPSDNGESDADVSASTRQHVPSGTRHG